MALSALEVHTLKLAPAVEGVLPVVLHRWSSRAFSDRAVSDADLHRSFEAARWSPSAYNEQPWRFVVGRQGSATHKAIFESLIGFNQEWAGRAPVLILGVARSTFSHNGAANAYALYDLGAATALLTLQAAELGLTSHQMAGFDHDKARKLLAIPEDYLPRHLASVGYRVVPVRSATAEAALFQVEAPSRQ